ncbi:MAG: PPK2 family polyphosphate kinase [Gemmatimonadaceae bacterium]|nr:PPK2 family polyphosphate kinase [Gemmatimonadaceae bacterium]
MSEPLKPLRPGTPPLLRDRDAAAPRWVPGPDELSAATRALLARASTLQGMLFAERRRAVLFVLQGRDASGKDGVLRKVFSALHPQGVRASSFGVPTPEEALHDFRWRLHRELPMFGQVGVWNRSHYEDILIPRVHRTLAPRVWKARYAQINAFEAEIADAGVQVVKLFIHISRDEQLERFNDRADDPSRQWKLQASDLRDRAAWARFTAAYRDVMMHCNSTKAPWYIVPSDKKPVRDYLVALLLVRHLERLGPVPPRADAALLRAVKALT